MGLLALLNLAEKGNGNREIWLDKAVRPLGFGWFAEQLPGDIPPSVLYAGLIVVVTNAFNLSYTLATGGDLIYTTNPYYALEIILLPSAVVAAHSLHREYDRAMDEMDVAARMTNPERLLHIVPRWLPWSLFVIAVGLQILFPGPVSTYGVTAMLDNFVVLPFVYTPIVVQFFTIYFSIEVLAPIRLWQSDMGIDFLDPEGVGGLRPIGELIKKSYYYIAIGLVGYALITYAPFIDWGWTVSAEANVLFTLIWVITIAVVAFGVFMLHRFMHREKRQEIRELKAELQEHIEDPYDVKSYNIPQEKESTVEDLRERITKVNNTSEYPATFNIWAQLVISIVLPKTFQVLLVAL